MKELSLEDKAKRYDEALKQIKECTPDENGFVTIYPNEIFPELTESEDEVKLNGGIVMEDFNEGNGFYKVNLAYLNKEQIEEIEDLVKKWNPELAESEDERIRKALIRYFTLSDEHAYNEACGVSYRDIVAWLEKQKEHKNLGTSTCEPWSDEQTRRNLINFLKSLGATEIPQASYNRYLSYLEKQGEQKPTDKVEPKFKAGDWVMLDRPVLIIKVEDMPYNIHQYWTSDGTWFGDATNAKLWNISDAKDGDVLATDGGNICVFDGTVEDGKYPFAYCGLTRRRFESYDRILPFTHDNVHPATKEQRDLLFQKMKEAGYVWDAEKKELKKIELKPDWSEESKIAFTDICENCCGRTVELVKNIMQPKQEWRQENIDDLTDFENAMMHIGGSFFGENTGLDPNNTNAIKEQTNLLLGLVPKQEWSEEDEWCIEQLACLVEGYAVEDDKPELLLDFLKSLRPQKQWKPSDEQMKGIECAIKTLQYQLNVGDKKLNSLYDALKKLRNE